jgi:8-oxo-dGTP pyrophosphatase MutT (NUDIX family)
MAGDEPFGVMVLVYRQAPELEILVLHRAAVGPDFEGDWAWTAPAGARFPAEPPGECAARELREVAGIGAVPVRMDGVGGSAWLIYALEVGPNVDVSLDVEHERFEWVGRHEAIRRCQPQVVSANIAAAISVLASPSPTMRGRRP